ncbi:MAG: peptidoglycan DD-metalloendopeptidase family protein [Leptolyngbyaceae cyanobacterium bins.59]|nr:peptidoglycan DD-metalloendopeptidase family protein [Leptolyngbyaceae cyanobacterium bins.59]
MKRAVPHKPDLVSLETMSEDITTSQLKQPSPDVNRRACTSAAMIGLAISVGASSLLMPQQGDGAMATEALPTESTATTIPNQPDVAVLSSTPEVEPSTTFSLSESSASEHIVREGQTLWDVARLYQVDASALAASNGIRPDAVLRVGQVLRIPSTNTTTVPVEKVGSTFPQIEPATRQTEDFVASRSQVVGSETQASGTKDLLKEKQETSLALLKQKREALNSSLMELSSRPSYASEIPSNLPQPSQSVQPSYPSLQSLVQPDAVKIQVSEPERATNLEKSPTGGDVEAGFPGRSVVQTEQPKVAVLLKPEAVFSPKPSETSITTVYRVNPGDTLDAIARKHNVSRTELAKANRLQDPNFIRVNQRLQIPVGSSEAVPTGILQLPRPTVAISSTQAVGLPLTPVTRSVNVPAPDTELPIVAIPTAISADSESVASPSVSLNLKAIEEVVSIRNSQSLALQPSTTVAVAPSGLPSLSVDDVTPSRLDGGATLTKTSYVEGLKAEVLLMREKIRAERADRNVASSAPLQTSLATTRPINPEFSATRNESSSKVEVRLAEPRREADNSRGATAIKKRQSPNSEQLMATAPMGSDAYDPLIQPLVGQVVSPELPPLAAASRYLPEHAAEFKGFIWPAKGVLTSGYGWRWGRMHRGIDIAGPIGTPIYAAAPGVVVYSGWNSGGYGNMVEIKHPDGSMTRYAHNHRNIVREGQQVEQGQQIAEMGSTGYSTGPHSHFEIHVPGRGAVNPIALLSR